MQSLLVATHLSDPLRYLSLRAIIACIGEYHEIQPRLLFVATILSAEEVFEHLTLALSSQDSLTIIDAVGGVVTNSIAEAPASFIEVCCRPRMTSRT